MKIPRTPIIALIVLLSEWAFSCVLKTLWWPWQAVWPDVKFIFSLYGCSPLTIALKHSKGAKVLSRLCQILNKPSKCCQFSLNFGKNGEISPNLVTLMAGLGMGIGAPVRSRGWVFLKFWPHSVNFCFFLISLFS